jgi:type IV pilus assembly protein PilB
MPLEFDDAQIDKTLTDFYADETEDHARILAQKLGLSYADLRGVPFHNDGLMLLGADKARAWQTVPFDRQGQVVQLASVDPQKPEVEQLVTKLTNDGYMVSQFVVSPASLSKAWPLYQEIEMVNRTNLGDMGIQTGDLVKLIKTDKSAAEVIPVLESGLLPGKKTTQLVELLVASAISTNASDIHLEPQEDYVQLRFRLDGVLQPLLRYTAKMHARLLSRLKLMSGLKLNVHTEPQDGRFSIKIADQEIEVRTSIMPGAFGESVVMRLLNSDTTKVNIDSLGMRPELLQVVRHEINKPNGLILTTGPTGSGKSTAIYSLIKDIYEPGIKIITIENPVEYHLDGVVQTQVNKDEGYDFYDGLRSALRQDPDVIMVGEIRDSNTAKTAIQAALTGHLVFSTLHTNDAAGAIPRLVDLKALPDTLGPAMNLILAQRLVRKVSPQYRQEIPLDESDKQGLQDLFQGLDERYWSPLLDRGTKFIAAPEVPDEEAHHGRIGVFEAIVVDKSIEELIRQNAGINAIREHQITQGLPTLAQDAALKALEGITTFEEVTRVVNLF